jgi:glycerol-3-phosphate responsive antiterminator
MGTIRVVRGAMPPLVMWIVRLAGIAIVAKWLVREQQRISDELDAARARASADASGPHPSLERDPTTGVYRPK